MLRPYVAQFRTPIDRHNEAIRLREAGHIAAALQEIEAAIRAGLSKPETFTLYGHILADLGRFEEAIALFQKVTRDHPSFVEGHNALAFLLPQLGRGSEALLSFDAVLADGRASPHIWLAALIAAAKCHDAERLAAWGRAGADILGDYPEFVLARALAHSKRAEFSQAIDILRALLPRTPEPQPVHDQLAYCHLAQGDLAEAEHHALAATALAPDDQSPWSLLTLIWRLRGDAREAWLADYDRLVIPIELGLSGTELGALRDHLLGLHKVVSHPAEQSLRGGSQTRGDLFQRTDPLLVALRQRIHAGVTDALAATAADPEHPFRRHLGQALNFRGSWSVRLRSGGRHVAHIHPEGWLSSAMYIDLPEEIGRDPDDRQGCLAFGSPDEAIGLSLPPRRVETPRPGKLVVFPSYVWHATLPFASGTDRLTLAFDMLPATRR